MALSTLILHDFLFKCLFTDEKNDFGIIYIFYALKEQNMLFILICNGNKNGGNTFLNVIILISLQDGTHMELTPNK